MAKTKKDKKVSNPVDNIQFKGTHKLDRPAIEAINEVAIELGSKPKDAARWICINCKSYAIQKAKEVKKLLAS